MTCNPKGGCTSIIMYLPCRALCWTPRAYCLHMCLRVQFTRVDLHGHLDVKQEYITNDCSLYVSLSSVSLFLSPSLCLSLVLSLSISLSLGSVSVCLSVCLSVSLSLSLSLGCVFIEECMLIQALVIQTHSRNIDRQMHLYGNILCVSDFSCTTIIQ